MRKVDLICHHRKLLAGILSMKAFLALLVGIAIGAVAIWIFRGNIDEKRAHDLQSQIEAQAKNAGEAIQSQLREWHLTGDDITNELNRTGRIIRDNAHKAGQAFTDATADARVTAAVKARLLREPDLSAWNISVATTDGVVTLSGSVSSPVQIGKAILLALQTDGARQVISTLLVKPTKPA